MFIESTSTRSPASILADNLMLEAVLSEHKKNGPAVLTFAALASDGYRAAVGREISISLAAMPREKRLVIEVEHLPMIAVSEIATGPSIRLSTLRKAGRAALRGQQHAMVFAGLLIKPWVKPNERQLFGSIARLTIKNVAISDPALCSITGGVDAGAPSASSRPGKLERIERPTSEEIDGLVGRFMGAPWLMQKEWAALPEAKAAYRTDAQAVACNRLFRYMALALTPISKTLFATGMCDTIVKRALTEPTMAARNAAKQHNAVSREELVHHFWLAAQSIDRFEPPLVI